MILYMLEHRIYSNETCIKKIQNSRSKEIQMQGKQKTGQNNETTNKKGQIKLASTHMFCVRWSSVAHALDGQLP